MGPDGTMIFFFICSLVALLSHPISSLFKASDFIHLHFILGPENQRLDCDSKNWTAFRQLLVSKMEAACPDAEQLNRPAVRTQKCGYIL